MKKRDNYFDVLKGILIILVLIGHFGADNAGASYILNTITYFIYIFHMPIFVFISGYFSKNMVKNRESGFKLMIMFVLFQALWAVISCIVFRNSYAIKHIWEAGPALWYILALSVWRQYLEHIIKVKHILFISLAVAVLSCFTLNLSPIMGFPRIIGFLPFFLMGYYSDNKVVKKIKEANICLSLFIILGTIILTYFSITRWNISFKLLKHNYAYNEFGLGNNILINLLAVIITYSISIIVSIAVMNVCVILENCSWLARLGQRTLPVYILSNYIQVGSLLLKQKFLGNILTSDYSQYAYAIVWIAFTTILLSSDWVVKSFDYIVDKWYKFVIKEN